MNRSTFHTAVLVLSTVFSVLCHAGEPGKLVSNLEAGEPQTVVTFGTSLTAVGSWVDQLREVLEQQYPGQVTVINGAQGGANSDWGRGALDEKVLKHNPDTVLIEFSVNDAVASRNTSVEHARGNLENMIDRILEANPACEIILMVMNPAVAHTGRDRPNLLAYNQMYRDVAKERGFQLIDHYPVWEKLLNDDPGRFLFYVPDTIHPVRIGALNVITPTMTQALGLKPGKPDVNESTPCWRYLFRGLMDTNKDRVITREEFTAYWRPVYDKSDANLDGQLTVNEFAPPVLFNHVDADKSGQIAFDELLKIYAPHFHSYKQDTFSPYKAGEVPDNVTDLWKDYDPRSEDLDVRVVKEWKEEGIVTRYITFKVGTFKGADSRIAAYYCFPENGQKNPAFVWCHGGGQRADRGNGFYFAKQGFATVDINWLGRSMEKDIEENTDWGKVDPTQGPKFYSKALRKQWKRSLQPDEYTIDPVASPRNNNWFLLTVAAKRAITFLEQQPEVNPERMGIAGFSMGGTVTAMTAMDPRIKAAAPFVGGTGFLHVDFPGGAGGPGIAVHYKGEEAIELYAKTVDPAAYWPHVTAPVMFLSSVNDFHAAYDRVFPSMALLPHKAWRVSANIHENHGPGDEQWILLIKWFNLHLKRIDQEIPVTPPSTLIVNGKSATFTVTPEDRHQRLVDTEIYYSYDPNPITRFWHRADARRMAEGNGRTVDLAVHVNLPLYVFALCRYTLAQEEEARRGKTSTLVVNSLEQSMVPENVDLVALANLEKTPTVDDFKHGFQDWSVRSGGREIATYKFQSPIIDRSNDKKLSVSIDPKEQKLRLNLRAESRFLGHGRDLGSFSLSRSIEGNGPQDVIIDRHDFNGDDGKELEWSKIARFYLSIVDEATKAQIDLTSEDGRVMLQSIKMVDPGNQASVR